MKTLPTDPVENLTTLIRCQSVTPQEGGALDATAAMLEPMGFSCQRQTFSDSGTPDVDNLYARSAGDGPHLMFAGHTDVVPPGDADAWTKDPFSAAIVDGQMFGRGTVDMKGGIACFIAALARLVARDGGLPGTVSLLITGDEEGPGVNGTVKLLKWASDNGERWDACVVGEPTNTDQLGDMVKIGRRGSVSGSLRIDGTQGHAAYPNRTDNPLRGMVQLATALLDPPLDDGTADFQPSNLEITSIDTGNPAHNVIPARATARFNIRFNDRWSGETLKAEIERRLDNAAKAPGLRAGKDHPVRYALNWEGVVSPVFLTRNDALTGALVDSIEQVTGRRPELSTSGGTSDARFVKDYCPVVEFGLVGQTMHMVDENVPLADLETLTDIYTDFVARWFAASLG